jgi:phosphoglycolate phosphatase/pyrophosphatase PpaX
MLKYPCLILDHDDTVVQSEATVNHPFFVEFLKEYRPGMTITVQEYISECYAPGYIPMCRQRFGFTDEELDIEYKAWKEHIRHHAPEAYPGIGDVLRRYKEAGGIIVVASQSAQENILRDYRLHIGIEPDEIFGWDLAAEHRKPNPYAIGQAQKKYGFTKAQMLVVDDMKTAVQMARDGGVKIAFAGWGRREFPGICKEMENLCDYSFYSTEDFAKFLFE